MPKFHGLKLLKSHRVCSLITVHTLLMSLHSRFQTVPKPMTFTTLIRLQLQVWPRVVMGDAAGFGGSQQLGGGVAFWWEIFCWGHPLLWVRSLWGSFFLDQECFKEDTINCAWGWQPQLPRAKLHTAGLLVLWKALGVPEIKFPVSVGVKMVCFGVVFDTQNSVQRLRQAKPCQKIITEE